MRPAEFDRRACRRGSVRAVCGWSCLAVLLALGLASCEWDQHFTVLGYTTAPNYDCNVKTVYVPIFKNRTIYRGLEFELTRAVIREIEWKTPFKVISCEEEADTKLTGAINNFTKGLLNRTQINEVREAETTLVIEVTWVDRRTGEALSTQNRNPGLAPLPPPDPDQPKPLPPPVILTASASFFPELGGSLTSAQRENIDKLARRIVYLMERPW